MANPIVIIQNDGTEQTQAKEEFIQTLNERDEPELIFATSAKKTFTYDRMNCSIEVPVSWNLDTTSASYRVIAYPYNGDDVMVTVKAYVAIEPITANTVYLYRSGSAWDRWHTLKTKVYDEKDCFLVGVDEKISGVYKNQELTEQLTLENTIVAEDVYVSSPDYVYIVTAKSSEATWRQYSSTIKEILSSFYVTKDN